MRQFWTHASGPTGFFLAPLALAVALWALYGPGYLSVDPAWSVVWGKQLVGLDPFLSSVTTTSHVGSNLLASLFTWLGGDADRGVIAVSYLAAGWLLWTVALTAREIAGNAAAILAAALLVTRPYLVLLVRGSLVDVVTAALVSAAVFALVRRGPNSVRQAGCILAVAGLFRPEPVALLVVLAAVVMVKSRKLDWLLVMSIAAVPLLWLAFDWAFTGDPLQALHATQRVNDSVRTAAPGLLEAALNIPRNLMVVARLDVLAGLLLLAAFVFIPERRLRSLRRKLLTTQSEEEEPSRGIHPITIVLMSAAILGAVVSAEALTGALYTSRFFLPSIVLGISALAAATVLVLRHLPRVPPVLVIVALVGVEVAYAAPEFNRAHRVTTAEHSQYELARAQLRPGVNCGPLVIPGAVFRPFALMWTQLDPRDVVAATEVGIPDRGTVIVATTDDSRAYLQSSPFAQRSLAGIRWPTVRRGEGFELRSNC